MQRRLVIAGAAVIVSALAFNVGAHEQWYIQGNVGKGGLVFPVNPTDNWRGDPGRLFFGCGDGNDPVFNLSFGGVCFGTQADGNFIGDGNHLVGTSTEVIPGFFMDVTTISIIDDQYQSVLEATWCQDINEDGFCGGNPSDTLDGWREEPEFDYCGSVTVYSPLSDITTGPAAPTFDGWRSNGSAADSWGYLGDGWTVPPRGNWDPTERGFILPATVNQGRLPTNACGNVVVSDPVDGSPVTTIGPIKWGTKGFVEHN